MNRRIGLHLIQERGERCGGTQAARGAAGVGPSPPSSPSRPLIPPPIAATIGDRRPAGVSLMATPADGCGWTEHY